MPRILKLILAALLLYFSYKIFLYPGWQLYSRQDEHAVETLADMERYKKSKVEVDSVVLLENSKAEGDWRKGDGYIRTVRHEIHFDYPTTSGIRRGKLEFKESGYRSFEIRTQPEKWDSIFIYYDSITPTKYVYENDYVRMSDPEFHRSVGNFKLGWLILGVVFTLLSAQWLIRILFSYFQTTNSSTEN